MSVVFSDPFTVGADVNIEAYPATPDYSLILGSAGDVKVNAANDRVQAVATATRRVRCIDASMPTDAQEITITGNTKSAGNRSQAACLLRCAAATDDNYVGRINVSSLNVEIGRIDAGVFTSLVSTSRSLSDGTHTLRFKAVTNGAQVDLELQVDATAVVTVADTSASRKTSGTPGFSVFNDVANECWLDNVSVDDLASSVTGTGALLAQAAAMDGAGLSTTLSTDGVVVAQASDVEATGLSRSAGAGVLAALGAEVMGIGLAVWMASGLLTASAAELTSAGLTTSLSTDGAISATSADVTSAGLTASVSTDGTLSATSATLDGDGTVASGGVTGTGLLAAPSADVVGAGLSASASTDGNLVTQPAILDGTGGEESSLMEHYTDTLYDTLGNAIAGATVTVYVADTLSLVTLYSNNVGTPKANPITTDTDGSFDFYAANGRVDLVFAKTGYQFSDADTAGIALFDSLYGQVAFPATQNPSTDLNTLDDYEEGTWTPDLGGDATYTERSGTYVKIGKMVFFQGSLTVNVLGTGATNVIAGLPKIAAEAWPVSIGETASLAVSPVSFSAQVGTSTQTIYLYGRTAGATGTSLLAALGNGAAITFSGSYRAQA